MRVSPELGSATGWPWSFGQATWPESDLHLSKKENHGQGLSLQRRKSRA